MVFLLFQKVFTYIVAKGEKMQQFFAKKIP